MSKMKGKPDLDDFIESGAANTAENKNLSTSFFQKPEPTVQKLFRLRWDTAHALKMGAIELSNKNGKRITETEIIENLLRKHFHIGSS